MEPNKPHWIDDLLSDWENMPNLRMAKYALNPELRRPHETEREHLARLLLLLARKMRAHAKLLP